MGISFQNAMKSRLCIEKYQSLAEKRNVDNFAFCMISKLVKHSLNRKDRIIWKQRPNVLSERQFYGKMNPTFHLPIMHTRLLIRWSRNKQHKFFVYPNQQSALIKLNDLESSFSKRIQIDEMNIVTNEQENTGIGVDDSPCVVECINCADKAVLDLAKEKLMLFSFETPETGRRKFIVASIWDFWKNYLLIEAKDRHYYEIIRQGQPCHLYLDLEFSKELNPHRPEQAMVELLLQHLTQEISMEFGIQITMSSFIQLDSTSDKKFSRHVILHLTGNRLWRSNLDVGQFISHVVIKLLEICPPASVSTY